MDNAPPCAREPSRRRRLPPSGGAAARWSLAALVSAGSLLPAPVLRLLARSAAALAYRAFPKLRRDLDANARRILGDDAPAPRRAALGRSQLASFAEFAVEIAAFERRGKRAADLLAGVEGPENLERSLAAGKGVVAVTLHLGNYELAAAALAARVPGGSAVIYERDPGRRWEKRRSRWRAEAGIAEIAMDASPFFAIEALALLRRGGAALAAADQVEWRSGDEAGAVLDEDPVPTAFPFLGARALFSLFPARLAIASGAPLLPAFALRAAGMRRVLRLEPPIFPDGRDARALTEALVDVFERYVRAHADEWLMLRPFWIDEARAGKTKDASYR